MLRLSRVLLLVLAMAILPGCTNPTVDAGSHKAFVESIRRMPRGWDLDLKTRDRFYLALAYSLGLETTSDARSGAMMSHLTRLDPVVFHLKQHAIALLEGMDPYQVIFHGYEKHRAWLLSQNNNSATIADPKQGENTIFHRIARKRRQEAAATYLEEVEAVINTYAAYN